ncbi:MAG: ABC transporter permease, partial [Clostridia bacterium]|nr:ABC transporter permease [Clostridia bacterium]
FWDELIMRFTDVVLSFPSLLLATAIAAMLGHSLVNAVAAIALSWWPWYTRIVRAQVVSLRERPFVEAARALGVPGWRIVFEHLVPNALAPVIVQASLDFGSVILTLAALSFLGIGAQPPQPEWGLLVNTGRNFFLTNWWYVTFPGLAILVTVAAFNLLGDGLREILDPRTRGRV